MPKIPFPTPEQLDAMAEEGRRMIDARRAKGPDPNSALIWFPPIQAAGLPVPRTMFVEYEPMSLWPICDGQEPRADFPIEKLKETAALMGYPLFVRTDLASAKHDGPKSYRANSEADLLRCLGRTFEDNACKDIVDFTRCWMLREFLTIGHSFTAFGGLPIGREWRFFADQDGLKCHHFYWPEEAFEKLYNAPRGGAKSWQFSRPNRMPKRCKRFQIWPSRRRELSASTAGVWTLPRMKPGNGG